MCLGTPGHLKHRFGAAYTIELRCEHSEEGSAPGPPGAAAGSVEARDAADARQAGLLEELSRELPGLRVSERSWGTVRASLPLGPQTPSMATIFRVRLRGVWGCCGRAGAPVAVGGRALHQF